MECHRYILVDHEPVVEPDLFKWAKWYEGADCYVALTKLDKAEVSTVFLGLDHDFTKAGPPLLFETRVFVGCRGELAGYTRRYSTWEEAEKGHSAVVERVRVAEELKEEERLQRAQVQQEGSC